MRQIDLSGKVRSIVGKKASREMRKEGLVPCNLYGEKRGDNSLPEALSFTAPLSELRKVVYTPHVYVVNLDIDGTKHMAIVKELQFHPVTDTLLHADFYEITEEKPIAIGIPVNLKGLAEGVRAGGRLSLSIRKVVVKAPYPQIPEKLDIDVTHLAIGKSIKAGELNFDGLEVVTPKDVVVCSVKMTRAAAAAAAAAAK